MKKAILNEYALNGYTVNSNLPIGTPIAWLSDVLPIGFLAFDGSEYNQSDYPELYNVVKNIPAFHSETEGKFKIPNLKGRVLQGADTVIGELIEAGLPNITSKFTARAFNTDALLLGDLEGGIDVEDIASSNSITVSTTSRANRRYTLLASKGETKTDGTLKTADEPHVFGNSDTVQPSAFTVRWIIKATQYASLEQNAIDDSKITNANALSAEKIIELINQSKKTLSDIETFNLTTSNQICPYDGFIFSAGVVAGKNETCVYYVNDKTVGRVYRDCSTSITIPVNKGDKVRCSVTDWIYQMGARWYK